jgi:hypothetical protein
LSPPHWARLGVVDLHDRWKPDRGAERDGWRCRSSASARRMRNHAALRTCAGISFYDAPRMDVHTARGFHGAAEVAATAVNGAPSTLWGAALRLRTTAAPCGAPILRRRATRPIACLSFATVCGSRGVGDATVGIVHNDVSADVSEPCWACCHAPRCWRFTPHRTGNRRLRTPQKRAAPATTAGVAGAASRRFASSGRTYDPAL